MKYLQFKMKHLTFQECTHEAEFRYKKTRTFRMFSNHDLSLLGYILWDAHWRQYVTCYVQGFGNIHMSSACEKEATAFKDLQMSIRKKEAQSRGQK